MKKTNSLLLMLLCACLVFTSCDIAGTPGTDGKDGVDGIGIEKTLIDENGNLIITFSNGQTTNAGKVVGADGKDGINGKDGLNGQNGTNGKDGINGTDGTNGSDGKDGISITKTEINDKGELIVYFSDNTNKNLGVVVGKDGQDGTDGKDGINGTDGTNGIDGKDGISITKTEINDKGELIIYFSNNTQTNVGKIMAEISDLDFYPLPDGTYGVKIGKALYLEEIVIPATYNGKAVTSIMDSGFSSATNLKKITLSHGITTISDLAFSGCENLVSIEIPNSVVSIHAAAFSGCTSLANITIPNSVTSIGDSVFSGCSSLTNITIPNSVTSIGINAFRGCSGLTNISLPNSVTSIGDSVFFGCSSLTNITIPNSVTSIGDSVFFGCISLINIKLLDGVTRIGRSAFYGCSGLKSISIPNSITSIGIDAFQDCTNLASVIINDLSAWYKIAFSRGSNPLENGADLYLDATKVTNLVIPDDVTEILPYTFVGCTSITSVTIHEGVTHIGNNAFNNCTNIESVSITNFEKWSKIKFGSSSSPLSNGAVLYVNGAPLTSFAIPNDVIVFSDIPYLDGCIGIETLTIHSGVTRIDMSIFRNCKTLSEFIIDENNTVFSISSEGHFIGNGCLLWAAPNTSLIKIYGVGSITPYNDIDPYAFVACDTPVDFYFYLDQGNQLLSQINVSFMTQEGIFAEYSFGTIYLGGSSADDIINQWSNVADMLSYEKAYVISETEPTTEVGEDTFFDDYWHYVDGVPTVW